MGSDKTTAWTRTLITCSTNQWHLFFSPPGPQELHWIHWETWHCGWNISSVWGCIQHPETTVRAPCLTNLLVEAEWGVCQIQGLCFQEPAPCQLWGWLLSSSVCAACALQGWCAGIATALEFSFTGVQGCSVDFVLWEVFLQDGYWKALGLQCHCCQISFLFPLVPGALWSGWYSPCCFGVLAY